MAVRSLHSVRDAYISHSARTDCIKAARMRYHKGAKDEEIAYLANFGVGARA